jgi:hypothetical protein
MESDTMLERYELQNKKLFLIIQPFYEYYLKIEKILKEYCYSVTVVYNQMDTTYAYSQNKILYFLKYIFRMINNKIDSQYLDEKYDIVLALGGYSYDESILKRLKKNNPEIKTIIYYWDSFLNWKSAYTIDWFDYRYSFDHSDCVKYKNKNLRYLPLFYINNSLAAQENPKYDILYIGSLSPFSVHRLFLLRKIKKTIEKNSIKAFLFLFCPKMHFSLKDIISCITSISYFKLRFFSFLFRNESFLFHDKLSFVEINSLKVDAKCLLDIPVMKQSGIPIGVIEALANGKKIITANKNIKFDEFYKPENIFILDNRNENKLLEFIRGNQVEMDISYLKIENWLLTILD